ncbi:MAG: dephospho-CoA kinase [Phycisphaerales bacterium]|nr:dephospho-CoA kinase [Phycisphaerales bacterium]
MNRPPVIGLAGGIGAGKSAAANALRELGCVVADADALAKASLDAPAIRDQLLAWWGPDMLDDQGLIDRASLAAIVFEQPDALERLEGIIHPEVERARAALFDAAPASARALVIDAPLLFEVGLDERCDLVIYIDASRETRLKRVAETRGWDARELDRREVRQLALDTKRSRADHVVVNEEGPDALKAALAGLLERLP